VPPESRAVEAPDTTVPTAPTRWSNSVDAGPTFNGGDAGSAPIKALVW